jgi:hypothetical protein
MGWATLSAAANRVASDRLGSVSVVAGAASGRGFLAINSEMVLGDDLTIIDYLLTVPTAIFGRLGYGDAIRVGDEYFKVEVKPQPFADGEWCRIPLMKQPSPSPSTNSITTRDGRRLVTRDGRSIVKL